MSGLRKKAFNTNLVKRNAGSKITEKLAPGQALQLGDTASGTRKYSPLAYMPVTVPENQQITESLNLVPPPSVPQDVTITVDTSTLGSSATKHKITFFDQGRFNRVHNPQLGFPAGTVYIGSKDENYYDAFLETMCSASYHIIGVTISVHPYPNATATAEQQMMESIKRIGRDWEKEHGSIELKPSKFQDNCQSGCSNKVTMSVSGKPTRLDKFMAMTTNVYEGMRVDYMFHLSAKTGDV